MRRHRSPLLGPLGPLVALLPLVGAALATPAAAGSDVTFAVKRGGDVLWKGEPCSADIWQDDVLVTSVPDVATAVSLEPGRYEAVVACTSDEGVVKRTVPVTVKGAPQKVPVVLEPGFLLVTVLRFDTPVSAAITIVDERGREVASSKEKAVIPLAPGRVRVLAEVKEGAKDAGGRPVLGNAEATIRPRQKSEVKVDTTDGELTVTLTDNGRKAGGVVALRAPGRRTRLVELRAGEKGAVPPGTYDLVTQLDDTHDFGEVVTRGVVIAPGKASHRAVAHRTGLVKPLVLVDGRRPGPEAKIDVELYAPGAPTPFNTVALGDAIKLSPGAVELAARRTDRVRDDGTSPIARQQVQVAAGATRGLTLDLASASLDVTALLGGAPRGLDVEVLVPGGGAPVAKKTAGPDGKTSFSLAPGRYTVKGILRAPQGDVVTEQNVTVALGARRALKLNLVVGTAVVQVFEDGVAVPAVVRFFDVVRVQKGRNGEMSAPQGDPVLAVPAGQEAILPPGTYALFVKRKGDERGYSDIKVAAGRTVERTVEVKLPAAP